MNWRGLDSTWPPVWTAWALGKWYEWLVLLTSILSDGKQAKVTTKEIDDKCHNHASWGIGLCLLFTISFLFVPPPRTFRNVLSWPTYHRHDSYSRPFQYDIEWCSAFHVFPGLSIWLHTLWTIYYKLYGIKYKYRVVAMLYLSLVFVYSLTILVSLSALVQFELCALLWTTTPCTTEPLSSQHHSLTHVE